MSEEREFVVRTNPMPFFKLMKEVGLIDREVYPRDLWGTAFNELRRYLKNKNSYICVYDGKRMAAYFCYYSVSKKLRDEILNDDVIHDDDISSKEIVRYRKGKHHYIYILSMAVHPDYRGSAAMRLLGGEFRKALCEYHAGCCFIDEILATAVSDAGRRTLEKFGLKRIKDIKEGYSVYMCGYDEFKAKGDSTK